MPANAQPSSHHPTRMLPAAVLWDMDGTLIDSEPSWIKSEIALAHEFGKHWTREQGLQMVGQTLTVTAARLRDEAGVPLPREELIARLLAGVVTDVQQRMPWRSGAREALSLTREIHIPCALVTMSYRVLADVMVSALPTGTFGEVITGEIVTRGKPDPEAYLRAAAGLGVDPSQCVAFEDSRFGVASALAAGCRVVAVPSYHEIESQPGLSHIRSLSEVTLELLEAIHRGSRVDTRQ